MSNAAVYQSTDTATQGSWYGVYGGSYPSYQIQELVSHLDAGVSWAKLSNISEFNWTTTTTDARALFKFTEPTRDAGTYYSTSNASPEVFDVQVSDGTTRDMALYFLDWDSGSRRQTVSILDGDTGAVLDTRNLNYDFKTTPTWMVWRVTGHVKVSIQCTGGDVSLVSAFLFSDPVVGGSGSTPQQCTGMFPVLF